MRRWPPGIGTPAAGNTGIAVRAAVFNGGRMTDEPLLARITIDPEICHGKPCIRGLRYPVEAMLEYLAGGDTIEELLAEFTDLERDDLLACLAFARRALSDKSQHLVLS